MSASASSSVRDGATVTGSTTMPDCAFFTRRTSRAWSSIGRFLWMKPTPPFRAMDRGSVMRQLLLLLAFLVACVGKAPPGPGDDQVDAPPAQTGQTVSGKTIDYFTTTPMADSTVATDGITPAMTATSMVDGSWALANVPVGSLV